MILLGYSMTGYFVGDIKGSDLSANNTTKMLYWVEDIERSIYDTDG